MVWIMLAGLSSVAVVAVAAWARGERRKAEAEAVQRRENARLHMEETQLLAKLRGQKES